MMICNIVGKVEAGTVLQIIIILYFLESFCFAHSIHGVVVWVGVYLRLAWFKSSNMWWGLQSLFEGVNVCVHVSSAWLYTYILICACKCFSQGFWVQAAALWPEDFFHTQGQARHSFSIDYNVESAHAWLSSVNERQSDSLHQSTRDTRGLIL